MKSALIIVDVHHSFMAALNYFYSQVLKTESFLNQ